MDVWAFEEGVEHLRSLSRHSPAWATYASATLALYRGDLLEDAGDASWVMGPRQRLQDTFRSLSGQWTTASTEAAKPGRPQTQISHGKGMTVDAEAARPGKTSDDTPSRARTRNTRSEKT